MTQNLFVNEPEEEIDPFDWGDKPPVLITRGNADIRMPKANEMLSLYEDFAAGASEKEIKALEFKVKKDSAQYARAQKHLEAMYPGYLWTKQEWYVTLYAGMKVKRDFLGFADMLGTRRPGVVGPPFIASQITTQKALMAHLRKYSDSGATSADETPTLDKLRAFLSTGSVFVMLGYFKEMVPAKTGGMKESGWLYTPIEVTNEMLDKAIGRKRKPRLKGTR